MEARYDTEAGLRRAHREGVTRRLPRFGALWIGASSLWALPLYVQGHLTPLQVALVPVFHAVLIGTAIAVCRARPDARRVLPTVFAACTALGVASVGLFVLAGGDGDFLAFVLLTLYLLAAIFFTWGWRAELALVGATVLAWVLALPALRFHVPPEELVSAIATGVVVSLVVAEGSAHAFAVAFRRRLGEQRSRQALEASRDEAHAARREAEAAAVSRDQFLAMLSHELRSPLGAVLTWTRMLRTGLVPDEKIQPALARIEEAARAQTRLIDDILDISRIAAGKFSVQTERVDLVALLDAPVEAIHQAASEKGITVDLRPCRDPVEVRGDLIRLRQILDNLLSNAVKFTSGGGRITVVLARGGGEARLTVSDTGIGISADVLPHVFEHFEQADRSITRRYGGLGLGLSIARHLAELHGGRIDADSPGVGRGATFTLHLPLLTEPRPAASSASSTRVPEGPGAGGVLERLRVLVVDDEPSARELLTNLLGRFGAEVQVAGSVREALDSVAASTPDVLLSDIAMAGTDGYTLIRRVRALERTGGRRIAAIAVTALASAEDRERALAEGFDAHLTKPIEPAELVAMVASSARGSA